MSPVYATREEVKSAAGTDATARSDAQVDRLIAAASRDVDELTHRRFWPEQGIRAWPWPDPHARAVGRLRLDADELIAVDAVTSGGRTLPAGTWSLEPARSGPPYRSVVFDGAALGSDVTITGLWGYRADEVPAGALAADLDAAATTLVVSDSSAVGVGTLLRCGAERLQVTGKRAAATGQALDVALDDRYDDVLLAVPDPEEIAVGETVLVDAERMAVIDTTPAGLVVRRGWDGSALAVHDVGAPVHAPRACPVVRGACGTTPAAHLTQAELARHEPPELVRRYVIAAALDGLAQEGAGYARVVGSGEMARNASGAGLAGLRRQLYIALGRKGRTRAV